MAATKGRTGVRRCAAGLVLISLLLVGCGAERPQAKAAATVQSGLHVYRDPDTGEFRERPLADERAVRVMPRSLQRAQRAEGEAAAKPRAGEYPAPAEGGGMMLDLPAPYAVPSDGAGN